MQRHRQCDDPLQDPNRLTVEEEYDGSGLITIANELTSSRSPRAQVVGIIGAIDMTEDEARWVHAALGELLAARDAKEREECASR